MDAPVVVTDDEQRRPALVEPVEPVHLTHLGIQFAPGNPRAFQSLPGAFPVYPEMRQVPVRVAYHGIVHLVPLAVLGTLFEPFQQDLRLDLDGHHAPGAEITLAVQVGDVLCVAVFLQHPPVALTEPHGLAHARGRLGPRAIRRPAHQNPPGLQVREDLYVLVAHGVVHYLRIQPAEPFLALRGTVRHHVLVVVRLEQPLRYPVDYQPVVVVVPLGDAVLLQQCPDGFPELVQDPYLVFELGSCFRHRTY